MSKYISEVFGIFCLTVAFSTIYMSWMIFQRDNAIQALDKHMLRAIPRITKRSSFRKASACLIIKDDNPRLIEWIAYHYQVLPLRRLVVTSDPSSLTSPTEILNRWRNAINDLEIIEWTENDYNFNHFQAQYLVKEETDERSKAEKLLIDRQYAFYGSCALYLKSLNSTWVFNIDSDEYVVFNNIHSNDPSIKVEANNYQHLVEHVSSHPKISDYGLPPSMLLNKFDLHKRAQFRAKKAEEISSSGIEKQMVRLRNALPKTGQKTILDFIHKIDNDQYSPFHHPCYLMPRLWISSVKASSEESQVTNLSSSFDSKNFNTLQYFRHSEKGGKLHYPC